MSRLGKAGIKRLLLAAIAVALALSWTTHITSAPIDKDSAQSVQMAVNLVHNGVMSLEEQAPFTPSDYREPVPVLVSAAGIALIEAVLGPAPGPAYFSGERLKYLKLQNILWLALLCVGVFWAVEIPTRSRTVALIGAILAAIMFSTGWASGMINDLYTDLPAGALLVLASAALSVALTRGSRRYCVLAGVLFGVLTLIKAAVMYVFLGMVGLLLCLSVLFRSRLELRGMLHALGAIALAFLCVVTPWMLRNRVEVGSFQVAQRAGVVLMVRATKDLMSREEFVGTFYVWAPQRLQASVGHWLGFGPADLQRGGRLQHLNRSPDSNFAANDIAAEQAGRPDQAISYYRRARAERIKLERELAATGTPNADVEADRLLQKQALGIIKAHPWQHLALTIPVLWRGAAYIFPVLAIALAFALTRRRYDIALLALPASGLVAFYALLSHFIPRYGYPIRPLAMALVVLGAKLAWDTFRRRLSPKSQSIAAVP